MDPYSKRTKSWLDARYRRRSDEGIYIAHQPIYGFRKGFSEQGLIVRYLHTFRIMNVLAHLEFNTLLDAGAAEGYKAYVAKTLFNSAATCSDISAEACRRASEIFGIRSVPGDIHDLPFRDDSFDVVLCSEALEHVTDFRKGVAELLRVSRKAVVITVPHEAGEAIAKNVSGEVPHAHIHHFDIDSFDYLKDEGYRIIKKSMFSPLLYFPAIVVDAVPIENYDRARYPESVVRTYNRFQPWLQRAFGRRSAAFLISADMVLCDLFPAYGWILIVALKDRSCWNDRAAGNVTPRRVIDISVPYHYLGAETRPLNP